MKVGITQNTRPRLPQRALYLRALRVSDKAKMRRRRSVLFLIFNEKMMRDRMRDFFISRCIEAAATAFSSVFTPLSSLRRVSYLDGARTSGRRVVSRPFHEFPMRIRMPYSYAFRPMTRHFTKPPSVGVYFLPSAVFFTRVFSAVVAAIRAYCDMRG